MSLPEVLLWDRLRAGKTGQKFRRQHPAGAYVADFYCSATRLVVEVDGQVHDGSEQNERDRTRDAFLKENGYRVLRVSAIGVMKDLDAVILMIATRNAEAVGEEAPLHRFAVPIPASGEDL